MMFAIYTAYAADKAAGYYTQKRGQSQAGTQRKVVGKALASHLNALSYVVVRERRREPYTVIQVQHSNYGSQGLPAARVYYRVESTRYLAATIDWDTGQVCELSAWPTQREAQQAAKLLHRAAQ